MSRIIIFTGKGGVGKTSVAAAHARKAAKEGRKTLLVSTDMAHNLGDLFSMALGREAITVCDLLDALEIDPCFEMEKNYGNVMQAIFNFFPDKKGSESGIEDIVMFPGIEELFSLLKILDIYESGTYDLIVVDCAPTGETLALLKMPELLSWYMEKFLPIERVALKVLRPVSKQLFKVEMPDETAVNDIEKAYLRLYDLQRVLKDRELCSIRLVTIPEKMVVEESKRNYMYLNLYNFNVDGIFINRILPEQMENNFFDDWLSIQSKYIKELENVFSGLPIYKIKWYEVDLNGIEALDRVIEDALSDRELFDVKKIIPKETYEKTEDGYLLKTYIPCVEKEELMIYESGTDLIIRIGNWKRSIPLPNSIRGMQIRAKKESDTIHIFFKKQEK